MYKNRIGIWIAVLMVWATFTSLIHTNVKELLGANMILNVKLQTDSSAKSTLASMSVRGIKINVVEGEADVIMRTSSNEEVNGYEKISDYIYSPIVIYVPRDFTHPTNMFYKTNNTNLYANMKSISNAILSDKTNAELGIIAPDDETAAKKPVLNIPSKGSLYYDSVIDAIYIGLNNNKIPTDEERKTLEPTVEALLEKAVECNDITSKMKEEANSEYNIFIAPEFCMRTGNIFSSAAGYGYYIPTYFEKSVIMKYDILINSSLNTDEHNIAEIVKKGIIENSNFCDSTIHRTTYSHNYSDMWPTKQYILNQIELAR